VSSYEEEKAKFIENMAVLVSENEALKNEV
jgi:hypothetical protein